MCENCSIILYESFCHIREVTLPGESGSLLTLSLLEAAQAYLVFQSSSPEDKL